MDSNSSTSFTIHICCWTRHDLDRETPASLGIIQTLWMEHRTNWSAKWHQPYLFLLSDGLGPLNGSIHSMKLHLLDLLWVYFVDLHLCTVTSASPNKNGGEDTVSEIHYKRTYVVICSRNLCIYIYIYVRVQIDGMAQSHVLILFFFSLCANLLWDQLRNRLWGSARTEVLRRLRDGVTVEAHDDATSLGRKQGKSQQFHLMFISLS